MLLQDDCVKSKKLINKEHIQIKGFKLTALALAIQLASGLVVAGPEGGSVVGGAGSIARGGNTTTINQQTDRMAINWQSYDVNVDERVHYIQPSSSSVSLNRILSDRGSTIQGTIDANGIVMLVNSNDVLFTSTASINVGGMIASGLDIKPTDFMNGEYAFSALEGSTGTVINSGLINASIGGSVTLLGQQVKNEGLIVAHLGDVDLAAGKEAVVSFDSEGYLGVRISKEILQEELGVDAAVINSGEIKAEGGRILLSASASENIFSQAVNHGCEKAKSIVIDNNGVITLSDGADVVNTGTLSVSSDSLKTDAGHIAIVGENVTHSGDVLAEGETGQVELYANDTLILEGSATVRADSDTEKAGNIILSGNKVGLFDNASVSASGLTGGGKVLIGGDQSGQNPLIPNAEFIYLEESISVTADGLLKGDGGTVIAFAENAARVYGTLTARGGVESGNGGFIETSGLEYLDIGNIPNASVRNSEGASGQWLIDPHNITITDTALVDAVELASPFTATDDNSYILLVDLMFALEGRGFLGSGNDVIVNTGNPGGDEGNIYVNASIQTSNSLVEVRTLTLIAGNDIEINATINAVNVKDDFNDWLNLTFNAGNDIKIADNVHIETPNGTILFNANNDIVINDGIYLSENFRIKAASATFTADADTNQIGNFLMDAKSTIEAYGVPITINAAAIQLGILNTSGEIPDDANQIYDGENIDGGAINLHSYINAEADGIKGITVNKLITNGGNGEANGNNGDDGKHGAAVMITVDEGSFSAASIFAMGGAGDYAQDNRDERGRWGGNGGEVSITLNGCSSDCISSEIDTSGGDASGNHGFNPARGGDAGDITLTASGSFTINKNLTAIGGAGVGDDKINEDRYNAEEYIEYSKERGQGGKGGTFLLKALSQTEATSITVSGGVSLSVKGGRGGLGDREDNNKWDESAHGGDAGDIAIVADSVSVQGLLQAAGGDGGEHRPENYFSDTTGNGGNGGHVLLLGKEVILGEDFNISGGVAVEPKQSDFIKGEDGTPGTMEICLGGADGTAKITYADDFSDVVSVLPYKAADYKDSKYTGTVFQNVSYVDAAGVQTLMGPARSEGSENKWEINSSNKGILNTNVTFEGIASLTGSTSNDIFTFLDSGALTGKITDSSTTDTDQIVARNNTANFWTLAAGSATDKSTLSTSLETSGIYLSNYSGIEKLVGGSSVDTFIVKATASVASVDGGAGQNIVDVVELDMPASSDPDVIDSILHIGTNNNASQIQLTSGQAAIANRKTYIDTITNIESYKGSDGKDHLDGTYSEIDIVVDLDSSNRVNNALPVEGFNVYTGNQKHTNVLYGADSANSWIITSKNSGTINDSVQFNGFQTLYGGSGDDQFFLDASTVILEVNGGNGTDTLTGFNSATDWNLENLSQISTVSASGDTGSVDFHYIENLVGRNQYADNFVFSANTEVSSFSSVDGGEGLGATSDKIIDSVDYSQIENAQTIDVDSGACGVINTEKLIGRKNHTLQSTEASQWILTGRNIGSVNSTYFSGFGSIVGSASGTDSFTFESVGELTGLLNGMGGTDTITRNAATTVWSFTFDSDNNRTQGSFGKTAADEDQIVKFIDIYEAKGGASADNFVFKGQSQWGKIDGGAGTGTNEIQSNHQGGNDWQVTGAYSGSVAFITDGFQNIQSLVGSPGAADSFTLGVDNDSPNAPLGVMDSIDGGGAEEVAYYDTLIALNSGASNQWLITTNNGGSVNNVASFSHIENITGNSAKDTFTLSDQIKLDGLIDGAGADTDTLDLSNYSTVVHVGVNGSEAEVINKEAFNTKNVEKVIVNTANPNHLTNGNSATTWTITGENTIQIGDETYTGFAHLYGGNRTDEFIFTDAGVLVDTNLGYGSIDGGGDTGGVGDSIESASIGATWLFEEIASEKRFTLTLKAEPDQTTPNPPTRFTHIATMQGGSGEDTFTFNTAIGETFNPIKGGDGVDTFTVNIGFTGELQGEDGNDIFNLWGGGDIVSFNGGAGSDEFNIKAAEIPYIIDGGGSKNDTDTLFVTHNGSNRWSLNPTYGNQVNNNHFSGIEIIKGGNGVDTFDIYQSISEIWGGGNNDVFNLHNAGVTTTIHGETQASEGDGDTLILAFGDTTDWFFNEDSQYLESGGARIDFTGLELIQGSLGVDEFTINAALTNTELHGRNEADIFNIAAAVTNHIWGGSGDDTFNLKNAALSLSLHGEADSDTLVSETSATNEWTLTGENQGQLISRLNTTTSTTTFTGMANLTGGAGNDTFIFGTGNYFLSGVIDGGSHNQSINNPDAPAFDGSDTFGDQIIASNVDYTSLQDSRLVIAQQSTATNDVHISFKNIEYVKARLNDSDGFKNEIRSGSGDKIKDNYDYTWMFNGYEKDGDKINYITLRDETVAERPVSYLVNFYYYQGGSGGDAFQIGNIEKNLISDNFYITGGDGDPDAIDFSLVNGPQEIKVADGFNRAGIDNVERVIGYSENYEADKYYQRRLIGINGSDGVWEVDGVNDGTYKYTINTDGVSKKNTFTFTNFDTLVAGDTGGVTGFKDEFIFFENGKITGGIDGGQGDNTVRTKKSNYNQQFLLVERVGGIDDSSDPMKTDLANIANIQANENVENTLYAKNQINTWGITGTNAGTVDNISFSGICQLVGGSNTDTFDFNTQGQITGLLDGGANTAGQDVVNLMNRNGNITVAFGNDLPDTMSANLKLTHIETVNSDSTQKTNTLIGSSGDNDWTFNGENSGEIAFIPEGEEAAIVTFTGFDNVTGRDGKDTFTFTGSDHLTGIIRGGNGDDSLTLTNVSDRNSDNQTRVAVIENGSTTPIDNADFSIQSIETVTGSTLTENTLQASNTENTWLISDTNIGTLNTNLTFFDFSSLIGGTAKDSFEFQSLNGTEGKITGLIDGGTAITGSVIDELDMHLLQVVDISLADSGNSVKNVEFLIGNGLQSTLRAANQTNAWTLDSGKNEGQLNTDIRFEGFNYLVGNGGTDNFSIILAQNIDDGVVITGGDHGEQGDTLMIDSLGSGYTTTYNPQVDGFGQLLYSNSDSRYNVRYRQVENVNDYVDSTLLTLTGTENAEIFHLSNNQVQIGDYERLVFNSKQNLQVTSAVNDTIELNGRIQVPGIITLSQGNVVSASADALLVANAIRFEDTSGIGAESSPVVINTTSLALEGVDGESWLSNNQITTIESMISEGFVHLESQGAITANNAIQADAGIDFIAHSGDIKLENSNNRINGTVSLDAGNHSINLTHQGTTELGNVTASAATLRGETIDGTGIITIADELELDITGDATFNNAGNHIDGLRVTNANSVSLTNADAISINQFDGQILDVHANGIILASIINTDTLTLEGGSGDIAFNQAVTTQTALTANTQGSIQQNNTLTSNGLLTLNAGGELRMSGNASTLVENGTASYTANGEITLNRLQANTIEVTSHNANIEGMGDYQDIQAERLVLKAKNGIAGNNSDNALRTSVNRLRANSQTGDIYVFNDNSITVEQLRNNGFVYLNVDEGDITLDNTTDNSYDFNEPDANLAGGVSNANFNSGDILLMAVHGNIWKAGISYINQPDIVGNNVELIVNPIRGQAGKPDQPLIIYANNALTGRGLRLNRIRAGVPTPKHFSFEGLDFDPSTIINLGAEQLVAVEETVDIDPAIFTAVTNYFYDEISIRLPRDQLYEEELEEYDRY